jgi:hypothetical protein
MIEVLFNLDDGRTESNIFNVQNRLALIKVYTVDGEDAACFDVVAIPAQIATYEYSKAGQNGCCNAEVTKKIESATNHLQTLIETGDCKNTWSVSSKTGMATISVDGYYKLRLRDNNLAGNYYVTLQYLSLEEEKQIAYDRYDVSIANCNCSKPIPNATLPLKGGGYIFRPSDIKDPLATVKIDLCDNTTWGYAYPTASAISPIAITACTATGSVIIGYATTTSSIAGSIAPDFC